MIIICLLLPICDCILGCISEFSGLGCSLKTVLDWGWGRVGQIKDMVDRLCKFNVKKTEFHHHPVKLINLYCHL